MTMLFSANSIDRVLRWRRGSGVIRVARVCSKDPGTALLL